MKELVINAVGLNSRQLRLIAIFAHYQLERDKERKVYMTGTRTSRHHVWSTFEGKVETSQQSEARISNYLCIDSYNAPLVRHHVERRYGQKDRPAFTDFVYSANTTLKSLINRGIVFPVFIAETGTRWFSSNNITSQLVFIPTIPKCVLEWFMFDNVIDYYLSEDENNWDIATQIIKGAFGGLKKFTVPYEENIGHEFLKSHEFIQYMWEQQVDTYMEVIRTYSDMGFYRLMFDKKFQVDLKEFCEGVSTDAWYRFEEVIGLNLSDKMLKQIPESWKIPITDHQKT